MKHKRSTRIMVYFTVFLLILVPTFLFVDTESILDDLGTVTLKIQDSLGSYTYTNKYARANVVDAVTLYEEQSDTQINDSSFNTRNDQVEIPTPEEIAKLFSSYTENNVKKEESPKVVTTVQTSSLTTDVIDTSSHTKATQQDNSVEHVSKPEEATQTPTEQTYYEITLFDTSKAIRGGGGGGGGSIPAPTPITDTTAPLTPVVTTPSDFSSSFATTTISFVGSAEADATLLMEYVVGTTTTSYTTTVDGGGSWNIDNILFTQGTTTISFYAIDASSNTSSATTVDIGIDTRPASPAIT
ncbi:hypothetical protein COW81_01960, partial [Candidatus Campbellbacteria bacterium CG22_combo_CG10-13_8_21_14_all_36_13]